MAYTRCLSLPVFLSLILVTFVYYTIVVLVIEPWMGLYTANGMLNGIAYTFWYVMVLWSYMLSTHMDPGTVPPKYAPEVEDGSSNLQEVKRKDGEPRFCHKCGCHKPPRTHHCRVCKRCVLRMVCSPLPLKALPGLLDGLTASLPGPTSSIVPGITSNACIFTEGFDAGGSLSSGVFQPALLLG